MKRYGWISISLLIPLAVFSVAVVISSSIRIRLALVLAGFIYMIIIMALFTRYFYAPRRRLLEALKNGHSLRNKDDPVARITEKYPSARAMAETIDRYVEDAVRENSAEILSKQTELLALQSQINPHFLFNTLDTIRGEAYLHDDEDVAEMLETLASFFRYSISKTGSTVRLRDEVRNVQNYMKIQEHRFRGRFHLEITLDEDDQSVYDCYVPRLILQPVVENSIYHGLEGLQSGGVITVDITKTEDMLVLTVSDNGKGMSLETLKALNDRIHEPGMELENQNDNQRNTGIALPNVNKRIQILYGPKYGLDVYSSLGQGTEVEIILPCIAVKSADETDEKDVTENQ